MWTRKEIYKNQIPIETWPTVNVSALNPEQAKIFVARKEAIYRYIAGENVIDIEKFTGVRRQKLSVLARKCLEIAPDGKIFGYRALIPYIRTACYQRKADFKRKRQHQQGGQSGALIKLLERFPSIEQVLLEEIRKDCKLKGVMEYKIRPKDLHRIFLKCARASGISDSEWPFNTEHKGSRSIRKYMAFILKENFEKSVFSRENSAAKAHLSVGTGYSPLLNFEEPFAAVEIDAYKIDAHFSAAFQTPEGTEVEVLLERLWLIAAVDRASTAIIAYRVVYRSEVTSDDVVKVIRDAVTKKWEPLALTIPLQYPRGGGLPSGVIPETFGAVWNLLLFDGALAHLSNVVHDRIRKQLGFIISWGAPGHFERRPNVERAFRNISENVFKRLPSTTGSNPQNGRASDGEFKALDLKIRANEVEEVLDVYIAQHNATPCEGISYLTPLEYIRHFIEKKSSDFILRRLPETMIEQTRVFSVTEEVTVRGSMEDGRRPYIQLDRVHYTSPVLVELANLIGEKLFVEIQEDDMRQVKAFLKNGSELGFLIAQGKWSITKHSRRDRRAINSLMSRRELILSEFDDPVIAWCNHLGKKNKSRTSSPISKKNATNVVRVAQGINRPFELVNDTGNMPQLSAKNNSVSTLKRKRSLLTNDPPTLRLVRNRG